MQRVTKCVALGRHAVCKERFKKAYRHKVLDEKLTRQRCTAVRCNNVFHAQQNSFYPVCDVFCIARAQGERHGAAADSPRRSRHWKIPQELRGLLKARKLGVQVPTVYFVDLDTSRIVLERVQGVQLKHFIRDAAGDEKAVLSVLQKVGDRISRLHAGGLVHGDLTTSNIIVTGESTAALPVFIDFGLAQQSTLDEDKAVDLYVLERAFTSAHAEEEDKKGDPGAGSGNCAGKDASSSNPMFQAVLEGYRGVGGKAATAVLRRLDAVRLRGRKRTMVG